MRRRLIVFCAALFVLLVAGGSILFVLYPNTFAAKGLSDCSVTYSQNNKLVTKPVDLTDEQKILNILDGNKLFRENLSCGFGESASISFNKGVVKIYIAQDTCGYLYSVNDKKYIAISGSEKTTLFNILQKYGLTFPCE